MNDLKETLLHALNDSWNGYESVMQALYGVTEEEALWQVPAYASAKQISPWPKEGTIFFLVAHISNCKRNYVQCIEEKSAGIDWINRNHDNTFSEELEKLKNHQKNMCEEISKLSTDDLSIVVHKKTSLFMYINERIRHDIWHSGQISIYRRLFKLNADAIGQGQ